MMMEAIYIEDNGIIWIGGYDGLFRYDSNMEKNYKVEYHTYIRKVISSVDSVVYWGAGNKMPVKINYKKNKIKFEFSAPFFEKNNANQYSCYLESFDENWSEWTNNTEKEYTNLHEGQYVFHVRAKNIYDNISTEDTFEFTILTPWNRTIYAYVGYIILLFLLVVILVKLYTKRLKAYNKKLEISVKERTHEINQQKEEISSQAENLLKANEELEKLSIAVSKTDNAIVIMDAKGNFEWVNDGFTRLYHLTFDEFIRKRGKNILECSNNPDINEALQKCIFNKKTVNYEFFYVTESSNKIWTRTTITPILNDNNEVVRLIAIDSDITDLKLAENEILTKNEEILVQKEELEKHRFHLEKLVKERTVDLEKAKEKAEESDRLKSSFLANMSHEIRTPMNAIIGFTNLLNDPEISLDERDELSKLVIHNSDTLLRLIDDVIDIAKLESGQLIIEKQDFDLNNLLNKIFEIFNENKKLISKDHLELKFDNNKKNERIQIFSDPLRIQQVLSNLINNGLKYTEKGFVEFGYKFDINQKNPVITFSVKDTGIGLSTDQQKIIFSRFTKVEDNKKKLYRGAGLGLAISKNIIKLLDGDIWVESELNHGSTFYFTVPFEKSNDQNNNVNSEQIVQPELDYNWSGKTILIAEDEENNYRYFKMILSKMHASILHAKNGIEAIRICQEKTIDLVLMDIKMPEMDGLEATNKIREFQKELPIIALTAFAMENDEKMSLEAGCNAYVSKPVSGDKLMVLINHYIS